MQVGKLYQVLARLTRMPYLTVDDLKNTAGDIALSFNDEGIYTIIRDAGIRAGNLDLTPFPVFIS
jgi:hypothetical protein